MRNLKGIVHFEIDFWYVLSYLKGIQDVGVFVSAVFSMLIFLGQTILVCQSYNGGLWSPPQRAEKQRHLHLGCPSGKLKQIKKIILK